jgi:hypothetical protein
MNPLRGTSRSGELGREHGIPFEWFQSLKETASPSSTHSIPLGWGWGPGNLILSIFIYPNTAQ